jgi:hypothetical protein
MTGMFKADAQPPFFLPPALSEKCPIVSQIREHFPHAWIFSIASVVEPIDCPFPALHRCQRLNRTPVEHGERNRSPNLAAFDSQNTPAEDWSTEAASRSVRERAMETLSLTNGLVQSCSPQPLACSSQCVEYRACCGVVSWGPALGPLMREKTCRLPVD